MGHRVIHICGTMGSGKTTLIKRWMEERGPWAWGTIHGSKGIMGYTDKDVFVAGRYQEGLQTSGCDAIKDTAANYAMIQEWFQTGHTVVYEGLFMMNHTRGLALWNATKAVTVLRLTTAATVCREGVIARRAAQGNMEPLPPRFEDGLLGNNIRATNYCFKMRQAGAQVFSVSREEAAIKLREMTSG